MTHRDKVVSKVEQQRRAKENQTDIGKIACDVTTEESKGDEIRWQEDREGGGSNARSGTRPNDTVRS